MKRPSYPKRTQAVSLPPSAPWPGPIAAWPGRRAGLAVLSGVAVLLLAIWAIPPMLDWGRFRGTIAAIAAARLGRPVNIGGEVTLRLLPRAVLTAADVTLPDQGDGVSATIASLRLEVATFPLLAGRLAPRDLVLGSPRLRLPWPLPETLARPARPRVPRAFAAHLDNGTLLIGGARVDGVNAALHSGPEQPAAFGAIPAEPAAAGFGAEGFAAIAGRSWRFTTALGVPDADGVSAVDLSISGQGPAARTDATVQGTLADGVLQGRLVAGGPDLSLLLPASALAWRAEAPFVADAARINAPSISLSLGGSPADAALTLGLTRPARIEARLHAASIDLGGWAGLLAARLVARGAGLPGPLGHVTLSADQAELFGGLMGPVHGTLALGRSSLWLEDGQAVLPGAARLTISGAITHAADGVHVTGPFTLDLPSAQATVAWLRPLAPSLGVALPSNLPAQVKLAGAASLGPSSLSVSGLTGEIDAAELAGGAVISFGAHPHLGLDLSLSRLPLSAWFDAASPTTPSLAELGGAFTRYKADVHVQARSADWRGQDLGRFDLDAQAGSGGLALRHLGFDTSGAHVSASGSLAANGAISAGVLRIVAPGPDGFIPWVPRVWRLAAPAWRGPASLTAALSGPEHDLSLQLRADAGDLVVEADGHADPDASRLAGSLTLRHPGAPRLLAALGVAGAERWLGTGSLALRAQLTATPQRVSVEDFDLRAADLGVGGHLTLDRTEAAWTWTGALAASDLPLPTGDDLNTIWPDVLGAWDARISLSAAELGTGGRDMAHDLSASLTIAHGAGLIDVARLAAFGGSASGQIAFDTGGGRMAYATRAEFAGVPLAALAPGWPIDVTAGQAHVWADVASDGALAWPASLSGQVSASLRDITLGGFDLTQTGIALSQHGRAARPALLAALSSGATTGLSGSLDAALARGKVLLAPARLVSDAGDVVVSGAGSLPMRDIDLLFGLSPQPGAAPAASVRLAGPWAQPRAQPVVDVTLKKPPRRVRSR